MDKKTFFILFTLLSAPMLGACGSSGGGGVAPTPEPTNLDPSFGTNGKVTTEFISGNPAQGYAMAIQGDDKIVMGGYAYNGTDYDFALARYNADGTLDTSFGSTGTGKVMTDFSGGSDKINAVVIDGSGKIVVAGYAWVSLIRIFALARYNANGSLDTSFGSGTGMVTTPFFDIGTLAYDQVNAIALQTDGKIVVAGRVFNGTNYDFALARYNADGSLDTSFNNLDPSCFPGFICNGKQRTDFNSNSEYAQAVVIQVGGKIIVSGYTTLNATDGDFAMTRYNTDGTLDTSFGSAGTGKVITPFYSGQYDMAYAMTLQTDGKIVVAGYAHNGTRKNFALARYNADGTLDSSFNYQSPVVCGRSNFCSGQVVTDFNGVLSHAYAMVIQPLDGKIVAAGIVSSSGADFALARYNTDGSLDTDFGPTGTGTVTTNFSSPNDNAYAIALQSDGKIVAAGYTYNGAHYTFALARYLP